MSSSLPPFIGVDPGGGGSLPSGSNNNAAGYNQYHQLFTGAQRNAISAAGLPLSTPERLTAGSTAGILNRQQQQQQQQHWQEDANQLANSLLHHQQMIKREQAHIDPVLAKSELTGLDMAGFRIKVLPAGLFRFDFLTELRLNHNYLTKLPAEIGQLRGLTFLDVSNNLLSVLPVEIGKLTNLRELLLYNNHLITLPAELGYLYQVETLGLDGNPIQDSGTLAILHSQGPLAVIPFLRDHIQVLPPNERFWQQVEPVSNSGVSFTIMSYNILAEKYATPQMYGYVPSWCLNWEFRKAYILNELVTYEADIICLQEVEANQFEQYFKPQLRMRSNYDGIFFPKSRAKTMNEWDRNFVDGCAIFFKLDRFRLDDKHPIEFNQLGLSRESLRKHRDIYNRAMVRDNVALIARMEHKESKQSIIVCNVHIHWDPTFRDVKLLQTVLLCEELEKFCARTPQAGLIVCGDFNATADSGVYTFLENGTIGPHHADFMSHTYEPYSNEGARHSLGLRNSYASGDEPISLTNFTPMFMGVIDYIWYKPSSLSVTGLLGSVSPDYIKQLVGFPSPHMPSDHVSVMAEFKLDTTRKETLDNRRLYSRNKSVIS